MKPKFIRGLVICLSSLALFAPQAKGLEIIGQIDMTGVAQFDAPLATATQVTTFFGAEAAIATGTFAAGGVIGDPLFGDPFSFMQQPWVFANAYVPLWAITGSLAPNTTFNFDVQSTVVEQEPGFLEVQGQGTMRSSDPAYDDTAFIWRFTSQGSSEFNRFSFSASAYVQPDVQVPDGGLTLGLLSLALVTVGGLREKFAR